MEVEPIRPTIQLDRLSDSRRFQLLVEAVNDYAIYLLDRDGFVASWNSGAQRFKGYTADEIIGHHFSRFYTDEDRADRLPERALRIAREQGRFEAEGWRVRKDGTRFWTSVVIDPIRHEDGSLIGFAKVTRDITERRAAQLEIERSREALAEAQKMEAIGRLTGGIAHDFNNLLTVIRSSIDLLRRPNIEEQKRVRYMDAIAETADRAAHLTGQLLAYARRQPLIAERFDIVARIGNLAHLVSTSLGSPVTLSIDCAGDVGFVEADPSQFDTAVLNIVINARDAMPSGGRLEIVARRVEALPPRLESAVHRGPFVALAIRDTGSGIEPTVMTKIFEPFFTTKPPGKGTGLGLSQVFGFAKQSGGEIAVESAPGEGTTVTLYLPRHERIGAEAPPRLKDRTVRSSLGAHAILVVEDNETVGEFAFNLFSELDQKVTLALNARDALEILEARADAFDIVFSDIVMPGLNGIELAQAIAARWPHLRIILASGYSDVLSEQGTHGFQLVRKPYALDAIVGALLAVPERT